MTALLEARSVTKAFRTGGLLSRTSMVALHDVSIAIDAENPTITVVAGESGSGKTTLARLLLGIIEPTVGRILYREKDVGRLSGSERKAFRRDVQAIFQDPFEVYNPFYKVDHVLTVPIAKFGLAPSRAGARALMESTLEMVGLRPEETLGRYAYQLSGGQRQRIMVARALLLRPRVIIADEAVSMIDASLRATILETLLRLHEELSISVLYITHDLTTAYQVGENIVVLYQGAVAEVGDVDLVINQPHHPYTQLLVGSIPLPDPDSTWAEEEGDAAPADFLTYDGRGCSFAGRCPAVMDMCRDKAPPLFQTEENRAASCYLYGDSPEIAREEMSRVFARKPRAQASS